MPKEDYDNTNRGALFRNDRKEQEKQPDYTGSLNVEGVDYWLSAWLRESKEGKKFFSMAVTPKEKPASQPAPKADGGIMGMSDDIPF